MNWPSISITPDHVAIAATCTLAELDAWVWPDRWQAAHLVSSCCRALLGSFKVQNTATVGGNICLALPAAPMVALAVALEGVCVIWTGDGSLRHVAAKDFVVGDRQTVLAPGEILREILLPNAGWTRASAFRQVSLTALGRSAALLIGSHDQDSFLLTITAATPCPVQLCFASMPSDDELAEGIDAAVRSWHDDVHGAPDWRRHVSHLAAQAIRRELGR